MEKLNPNQRNLLLNILTAFVAEQKGLSYTNAMIATFYGDMPIESQPHTHATILDALDLFDDSLMNFAAQQAIQNYKERASAFVAAKLPFRRR